MNIIQSMKNKFLANRGTALTVQGGQFKSQATADPMRGAVHSGSAPALSSLPAIPVAEPVERLGSPLTWLRPETIEFVFRIELNRGMMTRATWALHEAMSVCSMIHDKYLFWTGAVKQLPWQILTPSDAELEKSGAEKGRAEKQRAALQKHYDEQDVEELVEHLAAAKFYGYSIISKTTPKYSTLDWWNFVRNGMYGDWYWNGDLRITNSVGLPEDARMDAAGYIVREYKSGMLLESLKAFVNVQSVELWWNRNLEQESRRQCVVITGCGIADTDSAKDAASNISDGRSGWIEGGMEGHQTQVVYPPAARGLPYFELRLNNLDAQLTKALTGGLLMQLARSGSGSLAGSAHQETWQMILAAEAKSISKVLNDQNDAAVLREAGLLGDAETPMARFHLIAEDPPNATEEADITAKFSAAGVARDLDALGTKLGEKLEKAPEPVAEGPGGGPGTFGKTVQAKAKNPVGGRQFLNRDDDFFTLENSSEVGHPFYGNQWTEGNSTEANKKWNFTESKILGKVTVPSVKAWRENPADFTSATQAAAHYAKRDNSAMQIVAASSFGNKVYQVMPAHEDALGKVGRVGDEHNVAIVHPDGSVYQVKAVKKIKTELLNNRAMEIKRALLMGKPVFLEDTQLDHDALAVANAMLRNRADHPDGGKLLAQARAMIPAAHQADMLPVANALNDLYRNADALTPAAVKTFCEETLPAMLLKHGAADASVKAWQAFLSNAILDGMVADGAPPAEPPPVVNRKPRDLTPAERAQYDDLVNRAGKLRDQALRGEHVTRNNARAARLEAQAEAIEATAKRGE